MDGFKYSGDFKKDITDIMNNEAFKYTGIDCTGRFIGHINNTILRDEITDDIKSFYDYKLDKPVPFIILSKSIVDSIMNFMDEMIIIEMYKSECSLQVDRYLFGDDAAIAYRRLYDRQIEEICTIPVIDDLCKEFTFVDTNGMLIKVTSGGKFPHASIMDKEIYSSYSNLNFKDLKYEYTMSRSDVEYIVKYLDSINNLPTNVEIARLKLHFCLDGKIFKGKLRLEYD